MCPAMSAPAPSGIPRVSVVMAARNEEASLERVLESLRAQTLQDWELIAIDDASEDGTTALLHAAAERDPRIRILRNSRRIGLAASLNRGWKEARADLIARIDADDACLPHRLERQVEFMAANPDVAVLGSGAELLDEKGRSLGRALRPERHAELVARMYREAPFMHPSVLMRRSFLEALGGYDESLERSQDTDLWLRAYRRFRFHNLREPLIQYSVKRRPPLKAITWGAFVLWRGARREGLLLRRGWYSVRFLIVGLLAKLGLVPPRFGERG